MDKKVEHTRKANEIHCSVKCNTETFNTYITLCIHNDRHSSVDPITSMPLLFTLSVFVCLRSVSLIHLRSAHVFIHFIYAHVSGATKGRMKDRCIDRERRKRSLKLKFIAVSCIDEECAFSY